VNTLRKYFRLLSEPEPKPAGDFVEIDSQLMPVVYRRHARAKNYVMRLQANRTVIVTLPQRGSLRFAQEFVTSRKPWLEKQWRVLVARKIPPQVVRPGTEVLFRGRNVRVEVTPRGVEWEVALEEQRFFIPTAEGDLRPRVESFLQELANTELAARVEHLARTHGATSVRRVVVRNQKSRWGSCSYNGTISLNWRLIQVPDPVRDYIIIHELMHLRELNHSPRFWSQVERACPNYLEAEQWLKANSGRVGF
jgi:predicted metal-dependent hydrolase